MPITQSSDTQITGHQWKENSYRGMKCQEGVGLRGSRECQVVSRIKLQCRIAKNLRICFMEATKAMPGTHSIQTVDVRVSKCFCQITATANAVAV